MVVINELAELIDMLNAKGVRIFETPELKLVLGSSPVPATEEVGTAKERVEIDPRIEAGLRRLPPQYRNPSLWNLGDGV